MTDTTTRFDALLAGLTHADESVRRQAALALGASGDARAAGPLVERLATEPSSCVREDVTWATVQLFDAARDDVLALLGSPDAQARRQGAHVLSKVGDPDLVAHVVPLVADREPDVAIKAYRAAAITGGAEVVEALAARIGDGDALQRDALTGAFETLGGVGLPALVEALASPDAHVRAHAAEALGHLGTPDADAAAEPLARLADDPDADVRVAAVSALGELGDAADAALHALTASADGRVAAVAARLVRSREIALASPPRAGRARAQA